MVCRWVVCVPQELRSPFADRLGWAERGVLSIAGACRGGGSVSRARVPAAQLSGGGAQRRGRNYVSPTALPPACHIWKLKGGKTGEGRGRGEEGLYEVLKVKGPPPSPKKPPKKLIVRVGSWSSVSGRWGQTTLAKACEPAEGA